MLTYADSYVCSRMLTQALHGGKASELAVRRKEAQWEQVLTLLALLVQKYNPEASKLSTRFSDASRRKRSGRRYALYWLYWYKSTNLDAAGAFSARHRCSICVLTYADVC
jgi:hypothetical protein